MTSEQTSLTDQLLDLARDWEGATDSTPARLGRLVVNDTSFFTRLAQPKASTTTATLEKFARFLADAVNWPEGEVPERAVAFAHRVGVSVPDAPASIGQSGAMSDRATSGERAA